MILLAGGLDRGFTLNVLPALQNVKSLLLFGETAKLLAQAGGLQNRDIQIVKMWQLPYRSLFQRVSPRHYFIITN